MTTLNQPQTLTFKTYNSPELIETNLADPTDVYFDVIGPNGETAHHHWNAGDVGSDITRVSKGIFTWTVDDEVPGDFAGHWWATGAVATAQDETWTIESKYGAGTGFDDGHPAGADGLIYVATYRTITGDRESGVSAVVEALDTAFAFAEEQCRRIFAFGAHTETLDVWGNGVVYPKATPVASVTDPASATGRFGGIYVGGGSALAADLLATAPAQKTVTYTGGYHPFGSGTVPELPVKLVRAICRISYLALHPTSLVGAGVPAGTKSASVGDVSVSGDLAGLVATDPSIERDLRRFTRRPAAQLTR